MGAEDVDLLVATDAEGILGIGDQGVGGIEISIGKLAVYTQLIDAYVTAAGKLFPNAMLHWEDFGASNARRILDRYAGECCTFNDDMQGTAGVVLAAAFSAVRAAGSRMRDQRVVIHGAGTAGLGVADMLRDQMAREGLSREEATRRFWALGRRGILADDRLEHVRDFQVPYARPWSEVADWSPTGTRPGLAEVVRQVQPTMLIGTSTQAGAFTEQIVRDMAAHCSRPIIMPLSNPTSKTEALPADVLRWTDGRALWPPGARSRRSCSTRSPTRSPRPTMRWSSPVLGSA